LETKNQFLAQLRTYLAPKLPLNLCLARRRRKRSPRKHLEDSLPTARQSHRSPLKSRKQKSQAALCLRTQAEIRWERQADFLRQKLKIPRLTSSLHLFRQVHLPKSSLKLKDLCSLSQMSRKRPALFSASQPRLPLVRTKRPALYSASQPRRPLNPTKRKSRNLLLHLDSLLSKKAKSQNHHFLDRKQLLQ